MSTVEYLEAQGLDQYAEMFDASGYDELKSFASMSLDDAKALAEDEIGLARTD
jgi:hypothetical protein